MQITAYKKPKEKIQSCFNSIKKAMKNFISMASGFIKLLLQLRHLFGLAYCSRMSRHMANITRRFFDSFHCSIDMISYLKARNNMAAFFRLSSGRKDF